LASVMGAGELSEWERALQFALPIFRIRARVRDEERCCRGKNSPASSQYGLISPPLNVGDDPCPRTRQRVLPETP
jgi:hypothetical protein